MKNERIEELISLELDGELSAADQEELRAALAADPALAEVRDDFVNIGRMMREADIPEVKTPEATWQDVRREIRNLPDAEADTPASRLLPWKWLGGFAAAAAAIALAAFFVSDRGVTPEGVAVAGSETTVEFVSTDLEDAMTIVNVDPESGVAVIWVVDVESDDEG